MFRGQKSQFIVLSLLSVFVLSVAFTNCAKSLPNEAKSVGANTAGSNQPSPIPQLVASYSPAIVTILSSTTLTVEGGSAPYTLVKMAGAGAFDSNTQMYTATNLPEEALIRVTDSRGVFIDVRIPVVPLNVAASEQSFSQPGQSNFSVPTFNSLVVEVWGAGAGGQHCAFNGVFPFCLYGGSGGNSSFGVSMLLAQGGQGVNGGAASGGTTNIRGENGNWNGSNCPGFGGGAGGLGGVLLNTRRGAGPGGGGDSLCVGWGANGGGGGGYTRKEFLAGELEVGALIPVHVGAGGSQGGSNGLVKISWR